MIAIQPIADMRQRRGQTVVVALLLLGVLLILGFVFVGLINRNIQNTGRMQTRSEANDLAEAGVRYAHSQLLQSELGADWRGRPVDMVSVVGNPNVTNDPDAHFLRHGSGFRMPGNPNLVDLGGPDGLGSYTRVNYEGGRALVRVRYAPSDANIFSNAPTGALRNPGATRSYTIIESIGREGRIDLNDPTTLLAGGGVQVRGFANQAAFAQGLARLATLDAQNVSSRRLLAFASIGIIESARFITNRDRVSRPAQIGIPAELGASLAIWDDASPQPVNLPVAPSLSSLTGNQMVLVNPADSSLTPTALPGNGSLWANSDVVFHGSNIFNINTRLGDGIRAAGVIRAADRASLTLNRTDLNISNFWESISQTIAGPQLDSRNPAFTTARGAIKDGVVRTDADGFPRGVGFKTPPSILGSDPESGELRYVMMTRESGIVLVRTDAGRTIAENSGRFGHGRGIYVDNFSDRQVPYDERERAAVGSEQSLEFDWLNPGNDLPFSGWQGNFYIPRGALVEFTSDGFYITRDGRAPEGERYWRLPNGMLPTIGVAPRLEQTIRYRIGSVTVTRRNARGANVLVTEPYVINSLTPGTSVEAANPNFLVGQPFNGVLFFEGNVRVRGVIPTDVQITLVSNATIYIEGSLTKGVVGNNRTAGYVANDGIAPTPRGMRINRPSRSTLMLAAKDYVALNTTMFVGPTADTALEVAHDAGALGSAPVRLRQDARATLTAEFPLNPATGINPTVWEPFHARYSERTTSVGLLPISTWMVMNHTMDDGPADATFISMDVNREAFPTAFSYLFPRVSTDLSVNRPRSIFANNVMADFELIGNPTHTTLYGLGSEPFQRFGRFETVGFPLLLPEATPFFPGLVPGGLLTHANEPEGRFRLFAMGAEYATAPANNPGVNRITLRQSSVGGEPTNDYLLNKVALLPHNVRIEASIYAETGSFFVIPGTWFNTNPSDTRENHLFQMGSANPSVADRARADQWRLEQFGSTPITPFYGEPIPVRVDIIGSVSENMPAAISRQAEWGRKWGWMPRQISALFDYRPGVQREIGVPDTHLTPGFDGQTDRPSRQFTLNLTLSFDPVLATARTNGFLLGNDPRDPVSPALRVDEFGRMLPPMPRLPVSPTLAYFGEVN